MSTEFKEICGLFKILCKRTEHLFPENGKPRLESNAEDREFDKQGVYIIRSRRKIVLPVGRTSRRRDGLRGRLKDHLDGKSSFTIKHFKKAGLRLRKYGYTYQFLKVRSGRERALLEAYATGRLCPMHVGTGNKRQNKTKTSKSSRRK